MDDDDDMPVKKTVHEIGTALDKLSVDELEERIALLGGEIERLKLEVDRKRASRGAADSIFKL